MTNSPDYLLDSSVLIALASPTHTMHEIVSRWMLRERPSFATCPITQGAVIRVAMKAGGLSYADANVVLDSVVRHPDHRFVPDSIPFSHVDGHGLLGHQQVTDAYLAQLARENGLRLATLDRAQTGLNPDVAEWVGTLVDVPGSIRQNDADSHTTK